jgi:hypothetical protein
MRPLLAAFVIIVTAVPLANLSAQPGFSGVIIGQSLGEAVNKLKDAGYTTSDSVSLYCREAAYQGRKIRVCDTKVPTFEKNDTGGNKYEVNLTSTEVDQDSTSYALSNSKVYDIVGKVELGVTTDLAGYRKLVQSRYPDVRFYAEMMIGGLNTACPGHLQAAICGDVIGTKYDINNFLRKGTLVAIGGPYDGFTLKIEMADDDFADISKEQVESVLARNQKQLPPKF